MQPPPGATVLKAGDMYIMPGGIDPHTHLDMPFMGSVTADDFFRYDKVRFGVVLFCRKYCIVLQMFLFLVEPPYPLESPPLPPPPMSTPSAARQLHSLGVQPCISTLHCL